MTAHRPPHAPWGSKWGQGVTFFRGAQDRTSDPLLDDGRTISYVYDAAGDLVAVEDRAK